MFRRYFFQGIIAGVLAALAAIIYNRIYYFAMENDFSKVVNTGSMIGANMLACMVAALSYWGLKKWLGKRTDIVFNFAFAILSFASIMYPVAAKLPLDILHPELFPGLAIPMHFFPALAWFTINPRE